jgi:hypothetical protein
VEKRPEIPSLNLNENIKVNMHFYPGMGADKRIWGDIALKYPNAYFYDWIRPPNLKMSFSEYAEYLIKIHGINKGDIVIGVSMGALLAAEIKNQLKDITAIQVSGCTSIAQLNKLAQIAAPLAYVVPFNWIKYSPSSMISFGKMKLVGDMYKKSDKDFIKWGCIQLPKWNGVNADIVDFSILGDKDLVFPIKYQKPNVVIKNGSHLALVSHNGEIKFSLDSYIQKST